MSCRACEQAPRRKAGLLSLAIGTFGSASPLPSLGHVASLHFGPTCFPRARSALCSAIELDDTDISFLTNRAAVKFETADYEGCMADCDAAVSLFHGLAAVWAVRTEDQELRDGWS